MMRISATDSLNCVNQRGFTLLELMLVLVILALGSLLLVPNIGALDERSFPAQIRSGSNQLNYARRTAVVTGQPQAARFQLQPATADNADAAQEQTPVWQSGSIAAEYIDASGQAQPDLEAIDILFYPEGGSTGGELHFSQGRRQASIQIDPFSGRITTALE
ncbi:MAG: prepilin-type N-terminal cleavage/methylation domain-containing protein [Pseudomonadales bacterium]|nr:prepilin-type N-terminal cleavage/methylation domain-containing protein [Pseudomonadales bacterium]